MVTKTTKTSIFVISVIFVAFVFPETELGSEPDHQRCRDGQRLLEDTGMTYDASPRNCVRNPLDTLQYGLPKLMFDVCSPAEPAMTA